MEWSWTAWAISVLAVIISGALAWFEGNWRRRPGLAMGFANHGGMWSDLVLLSMANAVIVPHLSVGWWSAGALAIATVASVWVHVHWYRRVTPWFSDDWAGSDESDSQRDDHSPPPAEAHAGFGGVVHRGRHDSDAGTGDHSSPAEAHAGFGGVVRRGRHDSDAGRGDHMWPTRTHGSWARDLSWAGWAHVFYVIGELTLLMGFALHSSPADAVIFVAAIFTVHVPIGLLQPRWFLTGHIATIQEQPLLAPLLLALWAVTMVKL